MVETTTETWDTRSIDLTGAFHVDGRDPQLRCVECTSRLFYCRNVHKTWLGHTIDGLVCHPCGRARSTTPMCGMYKQALYGRNVHTKHCWDTIDRSTIAFPVGERGSQLWSNDHSMISWSDRVRVRFRRASSGGHVLRGMSQKLCVFFCCWCERTVPRAATATWIHLSGLTPRLGAGKTPTRLFCCASQSHLIFFSKLRVSTDHPEN